MQNDVRLIDANALTEYFKRLARLLANARCFSAADAVRETAEKVASAPTISAVEVVRCRECKNGAPLPEEARDEFSPGVMRCLAGRGDCDKYCTTWEDGFCDEGAKMDAKDTNVPTKDGGAADGSD